MAEPYPVDPVDPAATAYALLCLDPGGRERLLRVEVGYADGVVDLMHERAGATRPTWQIRTYVSGELQATQTFLFKTDTAGEITSITVTSTAPDGTVTSVSVHDCT